MSLYSNEKTGLYVAFGNPISQTFGIPLFDVSVKVDRPDADFSFGIHFCVAVLGFSFQFGKDTNYKGEYIFTLGEPDSQA